ncbi:MFS transporter [Paenibacillus selenitireducens]|jgi:predicted MFS family arabinose efflux permease|uniref:MFS transporter n=1 Tax=Paenibacillus selenitireducens TaxID=1324314 RepID=A0A1T2XH45_9BACL|nr:MFS transporter [Paenibacillus selenitireducens]OPA79204.1 MFS transporter [Paenibacillus selenitireducens]
MNRKQFLENWKYPSILLLGIGISNIGSWIYFIALNLIVLDMTKSPFAVSVLYILKPIATLLTNLWSGSFIDRRNKRNAMALLDMLRAVFIALLPIISSTWYIYMLVIFINMADSMFGPASMTYITKLIPQENRQRFNSLHSLISSGAFLIGPAVAGLLFLLGSPLLAIYINAAALLISGVITLFLPNLEESTIVGQRESKPKMSFAVIQDDWKAVMRFYRSHVYIMAICLLFGGVMVVMASAVDSLEASFATLVLHLTESEYGVLVSIAGAGIIIGAMVNTLIVKKIAVSSMIGIGTIGVCFGYLIFAVSHTFFFAGAGFFTLAFCLAFVNAGFATFYQNNVPVDMMGRIGSLNGFIHAVFIILATAALGLASEWFSLRMVIIIGVLVMVVLGAMLCAFVLQSSKKPYYVTASSLKG